ncbi:MULTISPECIES: ATP-binding protein [unclassified Streptomyces]|uniref:ATP-binding protein n=1 Tax=unclassified Streptomyces TaxID=2593676 RepID=UPI003329DF03
MPLTRQRRFPRSRASVRAARAFVEQILTEWGCVDRLDDIKLCVSELATNALLHGVPPGRQYCVTLTLDGPLIRLAVRDTGDHPVPADPPAYDACSGRGLHLARHVSDDFGITEHAIGKTVWTIFKSG